MKKFRVVLCIALALMFTLGFAACAKEDVKVTGVTIAGNITARTLLAGDTLQLNAVISPDNATNKEVTWSSSDPAAVTVSATGKVTAVAVGFSVVTVTTKDGNFKKNCTIYVEPAALESIYVETQPTKTTYIVGQKFDPAGAVVKGLYSDGNEIDITTGCTFTPSAALALTDTQVTVTCNLGGVPFTTTINITVTAGTSKTVTTANEFADALVNTAFDRIEYASEDADDYLAVAPFTATRDVVITGNIKTTSVTVNSGVKLTIGGMLKGDTDITVAGEGTLEINGNLYGNDITIGKINLLLTSVVDTAAIEALKAIDGSKGSAKDMEAVYQTSSLYADRNILINDGAVIEMYNNIFCWGTLTIEGGADVTVYGYALNSAQSWDTYGTGIHSEGNLKFAGRDTTVRIYHATVTHTGKAAIQSRGNIDILGATMIVDKPATTDFYYSYGIYLKINTKLCTITDGAQVTIKAIGASTEALGAAATNRFVINLGASGGETGVPGTMVKMYAAKKESRGNTGIVETCISFTKQTE